MSENEKTNGGRRIRAKAAEIGEAARDQAEAAYHQAEAAFEAAVEYAEDGLDEGYAFMKRQLRDRPLAVAGAALGVGLLLGLALSNRRR
ncbi:MAG TPA: hypothetical protein VG841_02735 [Caulobacterales bacterium]|nr:hypothetical protein [Caulobacterales bacterium]